VVLVRRVYDRHYAIVLAEEACVSKKDMYPMLVRMYDDGWLAEGWEPQPSSENGQPRPARRYYTVTDLGRETLLKILGDLAPHLPAPPPPKDEEQAPAPDRLVLMNEKEADQVGSLIKAIPLGEDARLVRISPGNWSHFTQRLTEIGVVALPTNASYTNDIRLYAVVPESDVSSAAPVAALADDR
jgi:DNA-binding PadR family transcriptional regulator